MKTGKCSWRRALPRFPYTHCSGRLIEVEMALRTNSGVFFLVFFSLWKYIGGKKVQSANCTCVVASVLSQHCEKSDGYFVFPKCFKVAEDHRTLISLKILNFSFSGDADVW